MSQDTIVTLIPAPHEQGRELEQQPRICSSAIAIIEIQKEMNMTGGCHLNSILTPIGCMGTVIFISLFTYQLPFFTQVPY